MRCLGIDYGARRIGLSFGDDLGVATPLPALTQADPGQRWSGLLAVIAQRRITDLVIGYPINMDETVGRRRRRSKRSRRVCAPRRKCRCISSTSG